MPQEQIDRYEGRDPITGQFTPANCHATKTALYQDPAVLEQAIEDYFTQCEDKQQPPMVTGLSLFLGFTGRQSLFDYLHRPSRSPFADSIKRAKSRIEDYRLGAMLTNKNNVIAGIFDLKNSFGYVDKQVTESDVRVTQTYSQEDRESLKAMAMQMIEAREMEQDDSNTLQIEAEVGSLEQACEEGELSY